MIKAINNKKSRVIGILILVTIVVIVSVGILIHRSADKTPILQNMEYRKDLAPIVNRFGAKIDIEYCYWKSDVFINRGVGPSSYWIKGFVKISKKTLDELLLSYPLEEIEVEFEKGISPTVTGFSDFDWRYSSELSREIMGDGFIGGCYLDINNGILFLAVESM